MVKWEYRSEGFQQMIANAEYLRNLQILMAHRLRRLNKGIV